MTKRSRGSSNIFQCCCPYSKTQKSLYYMIFIILYCCCYPLSSIQVHYYNNMTTLYICCLTLAVYFLLFLVYCCTTSIMSQVLLPVSVILIQYNHQLLLQFNGFYYTFTRLGDRWLDLESKSFLSNSRNGLF